MGDMVVQTAKIYIDSSTGEVVSRKNDEVKFTGNYNIFTEKGYKFRSRMKRVNLFSDMLPDNLSWQDKGRLWELARHMWQDTGIIADITRYKKKIYTEKDLYVLLGFMNARRGKQFILRMQKLNLIRKITIDISPNKKQEQWYLSPLYFATIYINSSVYLLWHDQIDKYIPDYARLWLINKYNNKEPACNNR